MLHNRPVSLAVTITVMVAITIITLIILALVEQEGRWMESQANERLQCSTERLAMLVQLFEDKRPDGSYGSGDHFRQRIYLF